MSETIVRPAVEPLTLEQCKLWARIDHPGFDFQLPMMIAAARQIAEHECGSRFITQTVRETLRAWPDDVYFSLHPVQSVSLSYSTDGIAWSDIGAGVVMPVRYPLGVQIERLIAGSYPTVPTSGFPVRADFVVGYGDAPEDVPEPIRQFIAAHVAYWTTYPLAANEWRLIESPFLTHLLDPFRTFL